ncbi:carboxymuconolactone decarboxylase family protein [Pseudodesulfovibrio sediminis]|uniref:DNA-binding protein n=1 Tax=Pseudodesulfovibrio sediminis TaxID=2810563 RepID=A0ABM7P4B6_9BACT|nr:carboxymuconolactone decarboxylase family protein [Pseudodesulfovibrio sediminis]BCS87709.1 DNA-binding protein [Pseudodesulfovibrio sediminis]
MIESQSELKESIIRNWVTFKRVMPEVTALQDAYSMEVYKDGVISGKHKRLMALVGALVSGCRGCILYQIEMALELGATVEEILEACTVAVSLGGTMASAQSGRVVEFLTEKGLMD